MVMARSPFSAVVVAAVVAFVVIFLLWLLPLQPSLPSFLLTCVVSVNATIKLMELQLKQYHIDSLLPTQQDSKQIHFLLHGLQG